MTRADANTALDVMAENLSVYKAVSSILALGQATRSGTIRGNVARILDSIIFRWVLVVLIPLQAGCREVHGELW